MTNNASGRGAFSRDVNPQFLSSGLHNDKGFAPVESVGDLVTPLNGSGTIVGTNDADTLNGTAGDDTIMPLWGADTVSAGEGNDTITFTGGKLSAADMIDGGGGTDLVWLNGDYSGANGVTFGATTLTNVERIALAGGYSYALKTAEATVGAGQMLAVDATNLGPTGVLFFDGSAETTGSFQVIGGAGADMISGGTGADVLSGRAGDDTILPSWGADTVSGGDGNDIISFTNGKLSAADMVDGGAGMDSVWLNGDYTGTNAVVFNSATLTNVESINLASGYSYGLTTVDTTVAAGQSLFIDATSLGASHMLMFDGSAETDGSFQVIGGAGADAISGGNGADTLSGRGGDDTIMPAWGADTVSGGDGNDTISFTRGQLSAADIVDGGAGWDTVWLNGDYTGPNAVTLAAGTLINVESVALAAGNSYDLTTADATVGAGKAMFVNATSLAASNALMFNGSAEMDGSFQVIGGAGADTIYGGNGGDTLSGRSGNDILRPGWGADTVSGGDGDDTISFTGGKLSSADIVDGGAGWDTVWLNGDYTGDNGVTFSAATVKNVEAMGLAGGHSYWLTTSDTTVAPGTALIVDGSNLGSTDMLVFNGSAETNGSFIFVSGSGADVLSGGMGADTFKYDAAWRSSGPQYDTISNFDFANDSFDIPGGAGVITGIDAAKTTGTLSTDSFDTDLAAAAADLGAHHAVLFTPNAGSLSGQTFMVVDSNGMAGYQSGQDFVIRLNGTSGTLAAGAFH